MDVVYQFHGEVLRVGGHQRVLRQRREDFPGHAQQLRRRLAHGPGGIGHRETQRLRAVAIQAEEGLRRLDGPGAALLLCLRMCRWL